MAETNFIFVLHINILFSIFGEGFPSEFSLRSLKGFSKKQKSMAHLSQQVSVFLKNNSF